MKKTLMIVAALLVVGGAAGFAWWQMTRGPDLPAGIAMSNGRLEAERIEIATKLAGRVADVLVSEGEWVEQGDVLARIDVVEIEAQLHQAQAAVLQARQQALQADALLQQRRSELTFAETEFARVEKLSTEGFSAQQRLDQQRTALNTARAGVAAAEAGIVLADATISAAEAAVERIRSLIDDASLTAPRGGRVQYVLAHAGEVVAAGGRVVTLTDLSDMYMTVFLPTQDAGRLAIGTEARIVLDALPDYVIPATVTFVASTAQFTPRSVETASERDQLMFRVKLTIAPDLLARYRDHARGGVPGVGYVRIDDATAWPADLETRLPQ